MNPFLMWTHIAAFIAGTAMAYAVVGHPMSAGMAAAFAVIDLGIALSLRKRP